VTKNLTYCRLLIRIEILMPLSPVEQQLFIAVDRNNPREILLCLTRGANINVRQPPEGGLNEATPLLFAAWKGFMNATRILLENGANATMRSTTYNCLPVAIARQYLHPEVADLIQNWSPTQSYLTAEINAQRELEQRELEQRELEQRELEQRELERQRELEQRELERQRELEQRELQEQRQIQNRVGFAAALVTAGLAMLVYSIAGKELAYMPSILSIFLIVVGVFTASRETVRAVQSFVGSLARFFRRAEDRIIRIVDGVEEVIIITQSVLGEFQGLTQSINVAVRELTGSTNQVVVMLRDELAATLVQLRGSGQQVATAISNGVEQGRFRPSANVVIRDNTVIIDGRVGPTCNIV